MALRTVKELEQGHFYSMKKSLLFLTMKPSILVGGQAVIEGVMMRVPGAYATAVRDPEGKINIQKKNFQSITERSKFWNKNLVDNKNSVELSLVNSTSNLCLLYTSPSPRD